MLLRATVQGDRATPLPQSSQPHTGVLNPQAASLRHPSVLLQWVDLGPPRMGVLPHGSPPWRETTMARMGFFDDFPAPEAAPPRRHHSWEPPEAELPGIVPINTLLLSRTDRVAVAVTGLSVFSAGIEIFLTARIRSSAEHTEAYLPGGPRDLAGARRSFRFGLQFSDGGKAAGAPGSGRPDRDSEPAGPVLYPFAGGGGPHSFVSRWWTWPLPPAGSLEFVCEWSAFGLAESRAGMDAQPILDAARRSIRLWPENEG